MRTRTRGYVSEGAVRVNVVPDAQEIAKEVQIELDHKVLVVVPLTGICCNGVANQLGQTGKRVLGRIRYMAHTCVISDCKNVRWPSRISW